MSETHRTDPVLNNTNPQVKALIDRYWRKNVRIMTVLLFLWAFVSLGCGILLADFFNRYHLGGIPLGFWFAQQGSIMVFVLLILIYCILLNRLDDRHHRDLETLRRNSSQEVHL